MQNVRRLGAWLIAGVSLCALGILLFVGPPFAVKAQESKRFQYKIIEVLPDTENLLCFSPTFSLGGGWDDPNCARRTSTF